MEVQTGPSEEQRRRSLLFRRFIRGASLVEESFPHLAVGTSLSLLNRPHSPHLGSVRKEVTCSVAHYFVPAPKMLDRCLLVRVEVIVPFGRRHSYNLPLSNVLLYLSESKISLSEGSLLAIGSLNRFWTDWSFSSLS